MVALHGYEVESVPIKEVAGRIRKVTFDSPLLKTAVSLHTCLGVDDVSVMKNEEVVAVE